MKLYTVAILGATGAVGQEMMRILEERNFPVGQLIPLASARSAGKTLTFKGEEVVIREACDTAFEGVDIVLGEIQREVEPDTLDVHDEIAVVAAVGRKMAFRPGISGKIFAALGQADINIRMINQGPDELNIIFGVDNKAFAHSIKVLYNSFVK